MPMAVPISTREHKRTVNQSVATPLKRTVASESTNQKPRHTTRKLYEHVSKTCSWWYPKFTPSGYKWKPKSPIGNVNTNVSMPLGNASRTANILEPMTPRCSTVSNTPLSSNSFAARRDNPIHRRLWVLKAHDGKSQASKVYYVEGLNHNLFSVGQFCDADLEVAFRKSTCYIYDLKGNDLLTGSRGTDLYSITLQDTSTPNPICLMAKATSSQAWLWHRRLSHLNFDTINLLSKNDIVIGLPKVVNVVGPRENVAGFQLNVEQADWRDDTDDEPENQELEAHYMYMAQIQEVNPDAADNSRPIFDVEPLQKVQNNDDNYNVFAIENEHSEQPESDDDDDLAKERDLLASLIEKLQCEIDDSKNRNKFLETSNKALVDKLKGEIKDFKTKNKSLESSNNHFKEANNELFKD
ncbi:retrovirus-related pol polyprotein from transposon TNT 1-94 [Tanacetum coccineum]